MFWKVLNSVNFFLGRNAKVNLKRNDHFYEPSKGENLIYFFLNQEMKSKKRPKLDLPPPDTCK